MKAVVVVVVTLESSWSSSVWGPRARREETEPFVGLSWEEKRSGLWMASLVEVVNLFAGFVRRKSGLEEEQSFEAMAVAVAATVVATMSRIKQAWIFSRCCLCHPQICLCCVVRGLSSSTLTSFFPLFIGIISSKRKPDGWVHRPCLATSSLKLRKRQISSWTLLPKIIFSFYFFLFIVFQSGKMTFSSVKFTSWAFLRGSVRVSMIKNEWQNKTQMLSL